MNAIESHRTRVAPLAHARAAGRTNRVVPVAAAAGIVLLVGALAVTAAAEPEDAQPGAQSTEASGTAAADGVADPSGVPSASPSVERERLEALIKEKAVTNAAAASSQERIDELSDSIDDLAAEYRRALADTRSLRVYNGQVTELIAAQEKEMASLRTQIENVTVVGRQVLPLMQRMIDTLASFVELDVPFLLEERRDRIAELRAMMDRADVTISEKYRRILEAYQVENEYGRTIEAYRAELAEDGDPLTVDFLRLGRVALLYQTLDAQQSGMWDAQAGEWIALPDDYRSSVRQGLRMARKQVAPDLIRVPVPAPVEVTR